MALETFLKYYADETFSESSAPINANQSAALPFTIWQIIDKNTIYGNSGIAASQLKHAVVSFYCFSQTYVGAKAMADEVRTLDGFSGDAGGSEIIQGSFLISESDEYLPPETAEEKPIYQITLSFDIWYYEE